MWSVMRHLEYQEKIVRILEDLYSETLSAVRVNGGITEWFATLVGVLQGCVLLPLLFNIFLEVVLYLPWYFDHDFVVATSCCMNNEPCQWEKANFDHSQLRHLLIDRPETQI